MEVFFRFGFGQLTAQDLLGGQAVDETNALDCFPTEALWEAAGAGGIYQAVGEIWQKSAVWALVEGTARSLWQDAAPVKL